MADDGYKRWALPGEPILLHSSGPEPRYASHDLLCILNLFE